MKGRSVPPAPRLIAPAPSRRSAAALSFATIFAAMACGPVASDDLAPSPGPDRYVHRFLPHEAGWRRESELPRTPQETPNMVIWEVSEYAPDVPPTRAQNAAAAALVEASYRAALDHGWYDFQKGLADGYQLMFQDRRHYENRAFILDEHVLDPDRPEFLMYYGTPRGKRLAGFMFYANGARARGPQIGGNRTLWHYHVWNRPLCLLEGLISQSRPGEDGRCARGGATHRSPEMIHVWLIDHPDGPFTTGMHIEAQLLNDLLARRDRERPETAVDAN